MTEQSLADIRGKIDNIDDQILVLLKERVHYCLQTASLKKEAAASTGIYDLRREQFILDRLTQTEQGDLSPGMIRDIYKTIISVCRNLQIYRYATLPKKIVLSVMGIEGSYSDTAASQFLAQQAIKDYELVYAITSQQVVEQLMLGTADYGVMGISNSTAGVVQETLKALLGQSCKIETMLTIPVKHCLMTLPNVKRIATIYSHEQALRQCRQYLSQHFPAAHLISYEDTALAAKHLATGVLPSDGAVVANRVCADIYNLQIVAENVVDQPNNATTFCVVTALSS